MIAEKSSRCDVRFGKLKPSGKPASASSAFAFSGS